MPGVVTGAVAGLNRNYQANTIMVLRGSGFVADAVVDVRWPAANPTIKWRGSLRRPNVQGTTAIVRLARVRLGIETMEDRGEADKEGFNVLEIQQVSVTVGDGPPTTIPVDLYDE